MNTHSIHARSVSLSLYLVAVFGISVCVGCGDPGPMGPPRVKTVPVTGKVVVDGGTVELPKQVLIRAEHVGDNAPTVNDPAAYVNPDGSFAFSTYETGDGVPLGEYKLTFQLGQRNLFRGSFEGDGFSGKYSKPEESQHTLNVTDSGPIDMGTIELTTK